MWEQIRSNQVRSTVLVIGMGLLLLALGYAIGFYFMDNGFGGLVIAAIVWGILTLIAFTEGDSILLSTAGARKIAKSDDPALYNVVEEMSIASGLSRVPDVYIIDDPALNAFSTGRDKNKAAVAITTGLRTKLTRDELQGVMAHEIAHIQNRDVALMAVSAVMLGAIAILAYYASRSLFWGGGRRRGSRDSGGSIIAIVAIVLIILAPIFAQLVHLALSRKREYLADASGALYTRYPEGLASALEKLGHEPVKVRTANQTTAPMFIVNPFQGRNLNVAELFATHPPLADRIRVLRAMAGPSYLDYQRAYEQVHGKGILPKSAVTGSQT